MDAYELRMALQSFGQETSAEEARRVMASVDRDGVGSLDMAAFAALVLARVGSGPVSMLTASHVRSVRQVFEKFDKDRSGENGLRESGGT